MPTKYLVKADLHNYGQTSNAINEGFESIARKARQRLGPGAIVGIVDVHELRYSKFKVNTKAKFEDLGNALYFPNEDILVLRGVRTFTRDDSKSILFCKGNVFETRSCFKMLLGKKIKRKKYC